MSDFGGVFAWGCNTDGQLGLGLASAEPVTVPRRVNDLKRIRIVEVAAGATHSAFLEQDGMLWTCGGNTHGQLGHSLLEGGDTYSIPKRVEYLSGSTVGALSAARMHTVVATKDLPGMLLFMGFGRLFTPPPHCAAARGVAAKIMRFSRQNLPRGKHTCCPGLNPWRPHHQAHAHQGGATPPLAGGGL